MHREEDKILELKDKKTNVGGHGAPVSPNFVSAKKTADKRGLQVIWTTTSKSRYIGTRVCCPDRDKIEYSLVPRELYLKKYKSGRTDKQTKS